MALQLQKPDHIIIYVSDMERSTAFYKDILGLPLKKATPGWTEFETGTTNIALHRTGDQQLPIQRGRPPAGLAQLGFVVDDLDAIYTELKDRQVHFSLAPQKQPSGVLLAVLHDPDGFGITLQQR